MFSSIVVFSCVIMIYLTYGFAVSLHYKFEVSFYLVSKISYVMILSTELLLSVSIVTCLFILYRHLNNLTHREPQVDFVNSIIRRNHGRQNLFPTTRVRVEGRKIIAHLDSLSNISLIRYSELSLLDIPFSNILFNSAICTNGTPMELEGVINGASIRFRRHLSPVHI